MSSMLAAMFLVMGCSKDEPPVTDPNTPVPDPAGTVTANISTTTSIDVPNYGYIRWEVPDNFYLRGIDYRYLVSICDLGEMKGLGNIINIPQNGYTIPQQLNSTVACEEGHGYVVKFETHDYPSLYVRLYVVESIISTSGGVMGAKVKYQFPFEPTSLSVSKDSLSFTSSQGTQSITVTTDAPDWTYSCSDSWVTLAKNNNSLSVSVQANESLMERTSSIIIQASEKLKTISIKQNAGTIPSTSVPYSIGDIYNENGVLGLVYKISNGGTHGMIVSFKDTACVWSTEYAVTGCTQNDGLSNMNIIKQMPQWEFRYPAFKWCDDFNIGGITGWYLPSIEEMKDLYAGYCGLSTYPGVESDAPTVYKTFRDEFDASLVRYGGNAINASRYWSSSDNSSGYSEGAFAWYQNFSTGYQYISDGITDYGSLKSGVNRVRAVRAF